MILILHHLQQVILVYFLKNTYSLQPNLVPTFFNILVNSLIFIPVSLTVVILQIVPDIFLALLLTPAIAVFLLQLVVVLLLQVKG